LELIFEEIVLADAWNKLEQYTRSKTKSHVNVFVMTGPLYLPSRLEDGHTYIKYQVIGPNNVAVPTHFFKVSWFDHPPWWTPHLEKSLSKTLFFLFIKQISLK
jgi:hypothetical protein